MSRAEDLAKKYCEGSSFEDACVEKPAYIAGYRQAEKNLELTWEDMFRIDEITSQVFKDSDTCQTEVIYQEVLKRFKDFKDVKQKI